MTAQGTKEAAPAGGFRRPPFRKRKEAGPPRPVLPGHIQWRKRCFWCLFAEDPGASGAVPPLFPRMLKDLAELSLPPFSFFKARRIFVRAFSMVLYHKRRDGRIG
ncbi:MAG: hypothetical protein C6W57_14535 [Caldibacillus debilis]|nr:hypothetical protein [Bacillaceae bacterium]OUM90260.1 MAG: hypothetical protein BAA03_13585 [Caldibacillus debilis]REJ14266.1 MAG: hypothetical protein C6W57_14535 [Caldibacillus debilis]REJ22440.1 MAG: hypothetical protein C6W56_16390 [Caldibacillus debilis]